jgi:leucyl/phenylalanyl-tRNA--protein transferase
LIPTIDSTVAARRRKLFRETPAETLKRWTLGTAWALKPSRITGLPALGRLWLSDMVSPPQRLPDPDDALLQPAGLCGIVHDLSVPTLLAAHRRGLYPFAHIMPLKWWSPPQRCVLAFGDFHMSRRMRSRLRQARYRVTFDRDFEGVIKACAGRREGKWHVTWITPPIMHAYAALHDAGHAHSFEVWNCDGALVGGGYGVAVGGAFTVESQFTRESHTSKIGFAVLNLAPRPLGLPAQRQQRPDAPPVGDGFSDRPAPPISNPAGAGRASSRATRPLVGGSRSPDRGGVAAGRQQSWPQGRRRAESRYPMRLKSRTPRPSCSGDRCSRRRALGSVARPGGVALTGRGYACRDRTAT